MGQDMDAESLYEDNEVGHTHWDSTGSEADSCLLPAMHAEFDGKDPSSH